MSTSDEDKSTDRRTGGEVLLKSSDGAEVECEGVRGGMPMNG